MELVCVDLHKYVEYQSEQMALLHSVLLNVYLTPTPLKDIKGNSCLYIKTCFILYKGGVTRNLSRQVYMLTMLCQSGA